MEGFKELGPYEDEPILNVETEFRGTLTNAELLRRYIKDIYKAKSVRDLHNRLIDSLRKLDSLKGFSVCNVEVLGGETPNSALIRYDLTDMKRWGASVGGDMNNEGGKAVITGLLRNIRGRQDVTQLNLEHSYNTGYTSYQFIHTDKLFVPGKWQSSYILKTYADEIDSNLTENAYGGAVQILSNDNTHTFEIGRYVRTNEIDVEKASLKLLRLLPVTVKNYASHQYILDTRNDNTMPTKGVIAKISNEIALGGDSKFHKIEGKASVFWPVYRQSVLQLSVNAGVIPKWNGTQVGFSDMFRMRYLKGFVSVGEKEPPANGQSFGDDFGSSSFVVCEGKLHFFNTPLLGDIGFVPFVYGNALTLDNSKLRGSVGFGLGWNTSFGRVELSYASRVWKQKGDVAASFQVLIGD